MRSVARRIGVPGLLTWAMFIGVYLWGRVPDGSWRWWDLAKYTAMTLIVSFAFGSMKEASEATPYVLCTSCGKRNRSVDAQDDLVRWRCGHCSSPTLVRVRRDPPA